MKFVKKDYHYIRMHGQQNVKIFIALLCKTVTVFMLLLIFIMFVLCRYIIVTITRLCSGLYS